MAQRRRRTRREDAPHAGGRRTRRRGRYHRRTCAWKARRATAKCCRIAGETQIFIFPGYRITSVDGLVTNFHLPESTLLMLVSAFAGRECVLNAYRHAVGSAYRFFSYGDAMLIWPPGR